MVGSKHHQGGSGGQGCDGKSAGKEENGRTGWGEMKSVMYFSRPLRG